MKDLTLHLPYEITSADTDMFGRLRLGAFVNFLIQSAIRSADKLGFGMENMNTQSLFWVLSRFTLQIEKVPVWYDKITIETWPKDIHKILYLRDYIIRDDKNNVIARATSGWLALNSETHRPGHVNPEQLNQFTLLKDKHSITEPPERLPAVNGDNAFSFTAEYFDIDLNKHLTSTRYIDKIMDSFSMEFHSENYPQLLSMNYMKETRLGDIISLRKEQANGNEFHFQGENESLNTTAFRSKIIF